MPTSIFIMHPNFLRQRKQMYSNWQAGKLLRDRGKNKYILDCKVISLMLVVSRRRLGDWSKMKYVIKSIISKINFVIASDGGLASVKKSLLCG
mmetsp:Transcript_2333/g.2818  ORF Transcript_2333/g.2818 Transcript_2333/m.2818 type:complete len:93 (+) Transcript_2333:212-490(+)